MEGRQAAVAAARADAAVAEATLDKARRDLERMARLAAQGLVSTQEHDAAQTAERAAAATLEATRRRLAQAEREAEQAVAEVRTRELSTDQAERRAREAQALLAEAQSNRAQVPMKEAGAGRATASVDQARADLAGGRAAARQDAPGGAGHGVVSKKTVEPGQLVQAGQPLLAMVPLHGIWVVANFKETQVGEIRPGQRVTVAVDTFPDRVFSGVVDSISAGTGSRFSLLPPENATGNWVKVVQRVPVKVLLDGYRPESAHPPARHVGDRHRPPPVTDGAGNNPEPPGGGSRGEWLGLPPGLEVARHRRRHGGGDDADPRHHRHQRRDSPHAGEPLGVARRGHLGLHLLPGRQRRRAARRPAGWRPCSAAGASSSSRR